VVFDTMVFVRALLNPYGIWGRLIHTYGDAYTLYLSQPVLHEIVEVLARPEIIRKYQTRGRDPSALLAILSRVDLIELDAIPAVCRDPKDDKFLATARAAGAQYLVSEDQDLLVLKEYEGTQIIDATTFLRILDAGQRQT
jgi:putative PIN family toxin of toxin-antitoxin system